MTKYKYTVHDRTSLERWETDDYLLAWEIFRGQRDIGDVVEIMDNSNSEIFASTLDEFN